MSTITKRALAEALKKSDGKEASFQNHCDSLAEACRDYRHTFYYHLQGFL